MDRTSTNPDISLMDFISGAWISICNSNADPTGLGCFGYIHSPDNQRNSVRILSNLDVHESQGLRGIMRRGKCRVTERKTIKCRHSESSISPWSYLALMHNIWIWCLMMYVSKMLDSNFLLTRRCLLHAQSDTIQSLYIYAENMRMSPIFSPIHDLYILSLFQTTSIVYTEVQRRNVNEDRIQISSETLW